MRYKELLSLLESEYDVEVGGASGVLRSAQSDFGTFRVENAAMITRVNAFIHNYLKEACLEPKQTIFGLRQKLNQVGLDFDFTNKNNVTEGTMDLKLTRFGGIFGKSDTTPFDQFDNEDGFEKTMGHGLTLKLETTIDESGLYKIVGKVIPTISETSEDVEEGVVGKAVKKVGRFIDGPDKTINRLNQVQKARAAKNLKRDADKYASSRVDADDPKNKNHPDVKAADRAYKASKSERPTFGSKKESVAAAKDHDGDGKIESGTDEWKGSRDKAIKKRMASKNENVEDIDELKQSTLRSYKEKAKNDRNDIARLNQSNRGPLVGKDRRDFRNRSKGVDGATMRLVSRKYDKED